MRVELGIDLVVYSDSSTKKNVLWKETDDAINNIVRTDLDALSSGEAQVAQADASDFTIPMGTVTTGKVLYISTDNGETTVILNGGAEAIDIQAFSGYRGAICLHGEFTSVVVTKPTTVGAVANVRYAIVGTKA